MGDFKRFTVWAKAHALVLDTYRATSGFPPDERDGLVLQIRRSAISVPMNIAEGSGRRSAREFIQFLVIARGSQAELEYQLLLARDLDLVSRSAWEELDAKAREVGRMLNGLLRKLRKTDSH